MPIQIIPFLVFAVLTLTSQHALGGAKEKGTSKHYERLDTRLSEIVEKHGVNTAAIGIIRAQKLVWQGYYGEQNEGMPASKDTLFNVASLTKTISAETVLRLAAKGELSLDESVSNYWVDPDLQGSSQVTDLTARMLLTHTSGFPNWRYFSADGKLNFNWPPGTGFGYSGEGFEYLAKYTEQKVGQPFDKVVNSTLFEPLGLKNAFITVNKDNFQRIAKPVDENGKFYGYYCHPMGYCSEEGSYSAAANLVITLEDYASILISSMQGEGLSPELKKERDTMHGIQFSKDDIVCPKVTNTPCPTRLGYGLGWAITEYEDGKLLGHRGTNWTVVSLAYYYPQSGDGLVIFFNAPNKAGMAAMVDALEILDPASPEIHGYRLRRDRAN